MTLFPGSRGGRFVERAVIVAIGLAFLLGAYGKMRGRADEMVGKVNLSVVVPVVRAYALDNGGYADMTLEGLQAYNPSIDMESYVVVDRGPSDFCVQTTNAGRTWHVTGLTQQPAPGECGEAA